MSLDDSPHAIALGVAIGVFVGLTPTVGVQTVMILAVVVLSRRFFYFNASAAMASTYISNPFTMLPMYYGWYRLGAWFFSGSLSAEEFEQMMQFEGLAGWWTAMCALGSQVAVPMIVGALLTAPFGVAIAYPATYMLVSWVRQKRGPRQPDYTVQSETASDEAAASPAEESAADENLHPEVTDAAPPQNAIVRKSVLPG